jgi:hypothetical protein
MEPLCPSAINLRSADDRSVQFREGANEVKRKLLIGLLLVGSAPHVSQAEELSRVSTLPDSKVTVEFSNASGKLLGSVTKIAGTTYYIAADGTTLGTSIVIDGRRVFTTY